MSSNLSGGLTASQALQEYDDTSSDDNFSQHETGLLVVLDGREIDISNGWPSESADGAE